MEEKIENSDEAPTCPIMALKSPTASGGHTHIALGQLGRRCSKSCAWRMGDKCAVVVIAERLQAN